MRSGKSELRVRVRFVCIVFMTPQLSCPEHVFQRHAFRSGAVASSKVPDYPLVPVGNYEAILGVGAQVLWALRRNKHGASDYRPE